MRVDLLHLVRRKDSRIANTEVESTRAFFESINRRYATNPVFKLQSWDESHGYRQLSLRDKALGVCPALKRAGRNLGRSGSSALPDLRRTGETPVPLWADVLDDVELVRLSWV